MIFYVFPTHVSSSDLGAYQQPARESLSTSQDVTVAGVGKINYLKAKAPIFLLRLRLLVFFSFLI